MHFHVTAVEQAGERIGNRHFDRHLHVVAQAFGIALLLDLRAYARQHLVLVDRTDQVVVDANLEPAHQPRIVVGFGDRKDRHVAGPLQRAHLTAQPQTVVVLEAERHDHQVVIALGGMKQRLGRIGFNVNGVLGR